MPLFTKSNLRTTALLSVFYLKVLAGISVTLIYTYYYKDRSTSDIYKYFDDARIICSSFQENPKIYVELVLGLNSDSPEHIKYTSKMRNWSPLDAQWLNYTQTKDTNFFNSNRIITRINAILIPFSNGNIFIHALFFSFLSFIGLFYLYKQITENHKKNNLIVFGIIFLLPSTLLWCSGPLKDTLVLSVLNILIYILFHLTHKKLSITNASLFILFIFLIIITKYYVAIALIPVLLGFSVKRILHFSPVKSYTIVLGALLLISFILPIISSSFNVWQILIDKREESLKTAIWAEANHQIFYNTVSNNLNKILLHIPLSISNAVLRPFIWEAGNSPFILLSGVENFLVALFLIICSVKLKSENWKNELLLFYLFFALSAAFIIGFTTPVTGGLVRYKTIFIQYLLLFALYASSLEIKFPTRLNRLIFKQY